MVPSKDQSYPLSYSSFMLAKSSKTWKVGIQIPNLKAKNIACLMFVDDLRILTNSLTDMNLILQINPGDKCKKINLVINMDKSSL